MSKRHEYMAQAEHHIAEAERFIRLMEAEDAPPVLSQVPQIMPQLVEDEDA
jgi:hypothetical protein